MRWAAVGLLCAGSAFAQESDLAPETSLVPEPRPAEVNDIDPLHEDGTQIDDPADIAAPRPELAECLDELEARDVVFARVEPIADPDDAECGIANPVQIAEIAPGVGTGDAIMRCDMALALATWVQETVVPATEYLDEGRGELTGMIPGSTYQCRRRNNSATGKLSEHAFGNAYDVMGFTFAEGPPLPVQPYADPVGSPEATFQSIIRKASCDVFTTVLGPGSDPAHDDHFHFDIKQRNGDYRICE